MLRYDSGGGVLFHSMTATEGVTERDVVSAAILAASEPEAVRCRRGRERRNMSVGARAKHTAPPSTSSSSIHRGDNGVVAVHLSVGRRRRRRRSIKFDDAIDDRRLEGAG